MKQIKLLKHLKEGENYVVFVGYDYCPSGFDIATFTSSGDFELQSNNDTIAYYECKYIYTLPPIKL